MLESFVKKDQTAEASREFEEQIRVQTCTIPLRSPLKNRILHFLNSIFTTVYVLLILCFISFLCFNVSPLMSKMSNKTFSSYIDN